MIYSDQIPSIEEGVEKINAALSHFKEVRTRLARELMEADKIIRSLNESRSVAQGESYTRNLKKKERNTLIGTIIEILTEFGATPNKKIFEELSNKGIETTQQKVNSMLSQYKSRGVLKGIGSRGVYDLAVNENKS